MKPNPFSARKVLTSRIVGLGRVLGLRGLGRVLGFGFEVEGLGFCFSAAPVLDHSTKSPTRQASNESKLKRWTSNGPKP